MKYFENLALSNSKISSFSHDPSYYYKLYVTKEITQKESLSLSLGTLVHCLILEPETFENKYLIIQDKLINESEPETETEEEKVEEKLDEKVEEIVRAANKLKKTFT